MAIKKSVSIFDLHTLKVLMFSIAVMTFMRFSVLYKDRTSSYCAVNQQNLKMPQVAFNIKC